MPVIHFRQLIGMIGTDSLSLGITWTIGRVSQEWSPLTQKRRGQTMQAVYLLEINGRLSKFLDVQVVQTIGICIGLMLVK